MASHWLRESNASFTLKEFYFMGMRFWELAPVGNSSGMQPTTAEVGVGSTPQGVGIPRWFSQRDSHVLKCFEDACPNCWQMRSTMVIACNRHSQRSATKSISTSACIANYFLARSIAFIMLVLSEQKWLHRLARKCFCVITPWLSRTNNGFQAHAMIDIICQQSATAKWHPAGQTWRCGIAAEVHATKTSKGPCLKTGSYDRNRQNVTIVQESSAWMCMVLCLNQIESNKWIWYDMIYNMIYCKLFCCVAFFLHDCFECYNCMFENVQCWR